MRWILWLFLQFAMLSTYAGKTVNVYVWGGIIPKKLIQQFEQETGITVNFSTYDSNETMFAKLRASRKNVYDVIMPSSYFVERMTKQNMLMPLDHSQLPELSNLEPLFTKGDYDPHNHYSVPLIWGATGIYFNKQWIANPPTTWQDLWQKNWRKQLLLLDDTREVFAIGLMSLGYNPNDSNPHHIAEAYQHLLKLIPNIKLFASDSIQAVVIDEDATIGSVWNGDAFKANTENKAIGFLYPQDGYVIWVDCLAIPQSPPHLEEAYQFLNFMLKAKSSAQIALSEGHAITNAAGKALLPPEIRDNPMVYPDAMTLKRGYFQRDVGEEVIGLFNEYWQQLKLAF